MSLQFAGDHAMTDVASSQSPLISYSNDEARFARPTKQSPTQPTKASPRFEAFVMTGEKILRLDPKISANYAKVKQFELPEHIEIATATPSKGPFVFEQEERKPVEVSPDELLPGEVDDLEKSENIDESSAVLPPKDDEPLNEDKEDDGSYSAVKLRDHEAADYPNEIQTVFRTDDAASTESPCSSKHFLSDEVSTADMQANGRSSALQNRQTFESDDGGSLNSTVVRAGGINAAKRLARRLYEMDGFQPTDVRQQLRKSDDFSKLVANEFIKMFNFSLYRVDAALRLFLSYLFPLPGNWEVDRFPLLLFCRRYHRCNPCLFSDEEEVYHLCCALLSLDYNLHFDSDNPKMSCHDFIEQISQSAHSYSRDLLKMLYHSVKSSSLRLHSDTKRSEKTLPSSDRLTLLNERLQAPDPESQAEYKKGWVMRKCIVDKGGKKVPFGRRGWRMFFAILKGTILYLQKDEGSVRGCGYIIYRNAIGLHHAYAERATDYTKKKHVFKLHTYTYAEYLFQTSEPDEVHSWVTAINCSAACFSSPKPIGVSLENNRFSLFSRPLLPSVTTKLSLSDQMKSHEVRIQEIEMSLAKLRQNPPCRSCKSCQLLKFAEKEVYLLYELRRYKAYVELLQGVVVEAEPDEAQFLSRLDSFEPAAVASPGGRSGQSDRLSYCAAIDNCMSSDSP
ncbi:Sec7 and PH 9 domain containing protein [Trichuris trichiura]|uniref:Sec7 and PH 9 domain containing protein n=1 Tax=Trichuris trichiura TaxID=36087 RepID=A0A077Z1Q1_TRITR|nr:Sec7 and PH 9 domain containing protein [Trichuris trichiura]